MNCYGKLELWECNPTQIHIIYGNVMFGGMICGMGVELTETHERLVACEKAIRDLKLGK